MGALLGRIGQEIGDRVEGAVVLHELFTMPAAEAGELLRTSKALLEQWHTTYMQVGSTWRRDEACHSLKSFLAPGSFTSRSNP